MTRLRSLVLPAPAVIAALTLVACSSSSTSSGATTSTSAAEATTTVATPADTTPPTTAAPTTVPAPLEFTLRSDGLGPFDLGAPAAEVVDAITSVFGPATSDESTEYPVDDGFGGFETVDGDVGFTVRFGRTVCWAIDLCVELGATDGTTYVFTGWSYREEGGGSLSTESGVTVGSRWSDVPEMIIDAGGCYSVGYGSVDGIRVTVQSSGTLFTTFDDLGNYIEAVPPANEVTILFMETGDVPVFLFGDC